MRCYKPEECWSDCFYQSGLGSPKQARESFLKSPVLRPTPLPSVCPPHRACQALENAAFGLHWEAGEPRSLSWRLCSRGLAEIGVTGKEW